MKKYLIYIICIISLLMPDNLYGNDIRTETYNGRTITEVFHAPSSDIQWYEYKIDGYYLKADSIKQNKRAFSDVTGYPVWNNPDHKNAYIDFREYIKNSFKDNSKISSTEDLLQDCCYLINDDGEVVCYKIETSRSLFDVMTPANILDFFDEINSFAFPTPVVRKPENGVGYEDVRIYF
jgi:hypothetical protein